MTLNIIPKPNKTTIYGGEVWVKDLSVRYEKDGTFGDEQYRLEIKKDEVVITSKGDKGKYYAELTLSQLEEAGKTPLCLIEDKPAFSYRGFMIDSARHMQTVDEIKRYITAAAKYKFNIFHWHLCDDQGWRIESEKYPLLNEKGSWRDCHGFGSENTERYGGYYTKEEIRDIVSFCKEKYIDVIPEFDVPGHATEIVSSYPSLSCRGEQIPVQTVGGIFRDILCAGNEEVYDFCFGVLDEIAELFPCEYIHIGGDEAPKARWCNCEKCQKKIKEENLGSVEELQGYFTNRIIAHLKEKGKTALCWNESLNSGILDKSAIICDWMDRKDKCQDYANKGGKIIIEDFYHYYLDYVYGMTPLKKTYCYDPHLEGLTAVGKANVLGVESPVWTEYIEDFDRMSYMCFPRLIAVAETGWTKKENSDYSSFKIRVRNEKDFLASLGITLCDESEWDPNVFVRVSEKLKRLKKALTPEAIKVALMPNKE